MPENSNTVQITLQFKDDGSVVIDQVKGKTNDLGKMTETASKKGTAGLKQLRAGWLELAAGVTAGYFAIKKGYDIIASFAKVAAEAEEIEKRMAFQTETWGYNFQQIKPYVDAFTDSIQATTRFSNDLAREALGSMMQYTSSVEKGMQGVRLAMDFATQEHMDLRTAIRYVGMGMEGTIEPLSRYILELRNLDKVLGENATAAEKAAYFLELFNKKYGGAAQKDLDTYVGTVAKFKNTWDDLKKEIGYGVLPVLQKTFETLTAILQQMEKQRKLQKESGWSFWSTTGPIPGMIYSTPKELVPDYEAIAEAQKKAAEHAARLKEEQDALAASMRRDPDRWKKWVEDFDWLNYAYEKLGIISEENLTKSAQQALSYAEVVKQAFSKGNASVRDYINALNVAKEAMEKLTGKDVTDQLAKGTIELEKAMKEVSWEDPDRQKKINKMIDDWLAARKELQEQMKIPVQADVAPAEKAIQDLIKRVQAQGINITITASGAGGAMSSPWVNQGITWEDYVKGNISFYGQGSASARGADLFTNMGSAIDDVSQKIRDAEAHGFTIDAYMTSSPKKPFSEKIQEMIAEIGGLENALSSIEADIKVAEYSAEYQKFEARLNQVNRILPDISKFSSLNWNTVYASWAPAIKSVTEELKSQMQILTMKMNYEMLKGYGSYQMGTQYVPRTGPYILHEGERVLNKNQISVAGATNHFYIRSTDPKETADEIAKVLKYGLHSELSDLIKRR